MLTIKSEIKEQKLDGTYNVKLRFTLDRKVKRLSTSLFVYSKDLTKEFKIKPSSPIKQDVEALIRSYYFKFRKYSNNVIKKAKEFDNSMIITILMSPNKRYSTL